MPTRLLKVNLGEPLRAELARIGAKSKLAKRIGISPGKLTKMLNDEWWYVTRDALERTADYLGLDARDVFEFVPVPFWDPIEKVGSCTFLRGTALPTPKRLDIHIPRHDDEATSIIKNFLGDMLQSSNYADHQNDERQLIERARDENCIVIGSPKSNAATEILVSRFFGAQPFNPSTENRFKIPFGFCWPNNTQLVRNSSLTCSELALKQSKKKHGIAVKDGVLAEADYLPDEEYLNWSTGVGRDPGLILVANRPFSTDRDVKLVVLAGFSGIGTLAAAKALIKDFRYLEPTKNDSYFYGVVQGIYSKQRGQTTRAFEDVKWVFRKGGGWPGRWNLL